MRQEEVSVVFYVFLPGICIYDAKAYSRLLAVAKYVL